MAKKIYEKIIREIESVEKMQKEYELNMNNYVLEHFWNIGKILQNASQSKEDIDVLQESYDTLAKNYGKFYNHRNFVKFKKFYNDFPNLEILKNNFSWEHIALLLAIHNISKRKYYENLVILNKLSARELNSKIKNHSYEKDEAHINHHI